jgi:hypothetical protein
MPFNSFIGIKVDSLNFHRISTDTGTGEWDGVDLGPQLRIKLKEEEHTSLTLETEKSYGAILPNVFRRQLPL